MSEERLQTIIEILKDELAGAVLRFASMKALAQDIEIERNGYRDALTKLQEETNAAKINGNTHGLNGSAKPGVVPTAPEGKVPQMGHSESGHGVFPHPEQN